MAPVPGWIMPVAPSAAVATTGRSTSIPIEIASGSPSVGDGQNTTTSQPDSSSAGSTPVLGTKCAAPASAAARVRNSDSVSPSPIISRCTGGPGWRASATAASIATSLRFLGLKRVRQPITNASGGMPSSARQAAPSSGCGR